MNCKKDDMAWIINPMNPINLGKIVKCVEFLGPIRFRQPGGEIKTFVTWRVSPSYVGWDGRPHDTCPDKNLRPILDPGEDATDEMVALLGKPSSIPSKETA